MRSNGSHAIETAPAPGVHRGARTSDHDRRKRARVGGLVVHLAVLLPAALAGQSPPDERMTLAQAIERGIERYPALRAARASRDAAHAGVDAATAARLPAVALTASAARYQEPMLVTPIHGFTSSQAIPFDETLVQAGALLSYTLFDGGARTARIRRAREQASALESVVDDSEQLLVARVTRTYVEIEARRQILSAHEYRIAALEAERSRSRQRYEVGRAPQVELLRAEAALASAKAERVRFAEALDLAERELARLTGAREEETRAGRLVPMRLTDSLLPPRAMVLDAARSASPALARARRDVGAADAGIGIATSARWPEVSLNGGYLQRGSANTRSWGEWSVGASLSFPLFTGGATGAEITRARAGRREAEESLKMADLQLAQDVDRALSAVEEAHAREASLTSAAARFAEVARIQKLALDAGSGTQTDYLAAEADLFAARASLAEASMSEIVARTELARLTGELSSGWVQRVLEITP